MSYDQDEGFDFEEGFKMSDYDDADDDEFLADEPILDDYEEEDPDSRFT